MSAVTKLKILVISATLCWWLAPCARAFTLLDFRSVNAVAQGSWLDWVNPRTGLSRCPGGRGSPFTLTFAIEANFMSNQAASVRAAAPQAVRDALATWSAASNGFVRFCPAEWGTVVNADTTLRIFFDGPSQAEYNACTTGCTTCWPSGPCPNVFPGWGANIDVFTRPVNWTLLSNGFNYTMSDQILAFTTVHRSQDGIFSIDIYLNSSKLWSAGPAAVTDTRAVGHSICPLCLDNDHAHAGVARRTPPVAADTVFDIQTVVLHELGHALGLDHPNDACAFGGGFFDPFTFAPRPCTDAAPAIMTGTYSGVNRSLTPDDIGGLAFLYRPRLWGDLDADDQISLIDAVIALDFLADAGPISPYDVNTMDFRARNGRIDLDEVTQVVTWAVDPAGSTPGVLPSSQFEGRMTPSTITISGAASPADAGLGSTLAITLNVSNPQAVPIAAWDFDVVFNSQVLSNPRISGGSILPSGSWLAVGTTPGVARFAKIGIATSDAATNGSLGTITFDVNPVGAFAGPSPLTFPLSDVQIVVTNPDIHTFGAVPANMETLVLQPPSVPSLRYDATSDGVIDARDLYQFFGIPFDVNRDGQIQNNDRVLLQQAVRQREPAELAP